MSLSNMQKRRPGGRPTWGNKYPQIVRLMDDTGLPMYEIAIINNMHPESLGRLLRFGALSDEDADHIVSEVCRYVERQTGVTHDGAEG